MDWFFLDRREYDRMRRDARKGLAKDLKSRPRKRDRDYNFGVSKAELEQIRRQARA